MEKLIQIFFPDLNENVLVKLDDSKSPKTVKELLDSLPIEVKINKWGKELYTDKIPVRLREENAKSELNILDVAFWPDGSALCLFYGPTPISRSDKIEPYSPVNVIGRIVSEQSDIISRVRQGSRVIIKHAQSHY
jgi:uncharacterized protein